jgi:enamine deaminase RidA (YjgF/YER057c/UK114 family)
VSNQVLAEHGSSPEHIIAATIYVTDMEQKPAMNAAWGDWFSVDAVPTPTNTYASIDPESGLQIEASE